ncbi:MAG TPA: FecR domain-containing protein [Bradyrhizobium sp.]|nr:FecR domain-containing protein [Bradyrhizobium sp.]
MLAGPANVFAMPSPIETKDVPAPLRATSAATQFSQAQPAPTPQTPAAPAADPATDAQAAGDEPIGNVATLTGIATVIRKRDSIALKLKDDIFQNDVLQTSANSTLGVTFNDATTFNLTANARITVDSFVYEDGGKQNAALFDVVKGTVAFVAAAVAKTGDMKISTPTATMGIRGTSGLVEVPEGASATSRNNVAIKLYPDADGKVGRIEVHDRAGVRLGFLTQGASGFTIRPETGARFAAVPLTISPQQALRDRGFVHQVHSTQNVGRQVVTQQRALRRANPALNNPNRANQPRQPGPQRQNGLPQQPGSQQPGSPNRPGQPSPNLPNRQGQQQRPGSPTQPGLLPRAGQPQQPGGRAQPGSQNAPGVRQPPNLQQQPNAPGVQRPGLQNRPQFQQRRPALPAPKGKPRKERRQG